MYVQGLPDTSRTSALQMGGWEHHGWGQDRHIIAGIYDGILHNTEATGNWRKPPSLGRWPRPESKPVEEKPKGPVSVKDFYNNIQKQRGR